MKGRDFTSDKYRYGFNGMEKDDEVKGASDSYDYGMRFYDARIGRPFKPDPLTKEYPSLSPYQFFTNNPIMNIDLDGLEGVNANDFNLPIRTTPYLGSQYHDYGHAAGYAPMVAGREGQILGVGLPKFYWDPYATALNGQKGANMLQKPVLKTSNSTQINANTAPVAQGVQNNVSNVNGGFISNQPNFLPGGIGQINAIAQQALPTTTTQAVGNPVTDAPVVATTTNKEGLPITTTTTNTNQPIQVTTTNSIITVNLATQIGAGTVLPSGQTGAQLVQQRFNAISAQLQGQGISAANIVQGAPQFNQANLPSGNQTTYNVNTTTTTSTGTQTTTTTETKEYTYGE